MILSATTIPIHAQERPSATPIVVKLFTPTPYVERSVATVTPTFTPTPASLALLEVREEAGSVNVRTEPGPEADQLGSISFGTLYPVYRQFYSWYEIQYELSPTGYGWIYGGLTDIIGDVGEIQIIENFDWATPQGVFNPEPTETLELSEEDILTVTANARIIQIPTSSEDSNATVISAVDPIPTFTYPPDVLAQAPTQSASLVRRNTDTSTSSMPPVFPILLLGGVGIIGLLLNSLRR